jgi:hypothetical protein
MNSIVLMGSSTLRSLRPLTADSASIRNPDTGSLTTYRRFNKPSYGPLGDSLDDFV